METAANEKYNIFQTGGIVVANFAADSQARGVCLERGYGNQFFLSRSSTAFCGY